ncbi:MAG: hypothetical protein ABIA12_01475 [Candidatus Aenigmatarchaeota archaeon]
MGTTAERRCKSEYVRVVPKGVKKILETGESPIDGMYLKVSEIENSNGHIITYDKKK